MHRARCMTGMLALGALLATAACTPSETTPDTTTAPTTTSTTIATPDVPVVVSVSADGEVARYAMLDMVVDVDAEYENPFDQREVALDAVFTAPSGDTMVVPGFWDAVDAWRFRFTPDEVGTWTYDVTVADGRGSSEAASGSFEATASDARGFLRIGSDVDPTYSSRYFAYEDGTPWYGRGHADLQMSFGGGATDGSGLKKIKDMADSGENYEMWWPMWANNFIQQTYDDYQPGPMQTIDYIVGEAEQNDVAIVFTVWGHQYLRTGEHDWPDDLWASNGFSSLSTLAEFFVEDEPWAWQENLYRYIIARWSYSPSIVMWQTITEINGTESYGQTDTWHRRLDQYFKDNDPFEHPTTATGSGDWDWPAGHHEMDVAQVHMYHYFEFNPVLAGERMADWTRKMWNRVEKPNWIGEYGERGPQHYPEMLHNSNWGTLGGGSAMTPIEWNDGASYNTFTDEMAADMKRFADFVEEVPLVAYAPEAVGVVSSDTMVRGWGVAGETGGVVWLQDFSLQDAELEEQRIGRDVSGLTVEINGLTNGAWTVRPYDTWTGVWLPEYAVECSVDPCAVAVPDFNKDIALALSR